MTNQAPLREMLLEVKDLKTHFFLGRGVVRAVDGVSFEMRRGQTLGVLGESGCGKSVTGYSILRLIRPPGKTISGEMLLHRSSTSHEGRATTEIIDLAKLDPQGRAIRSIRGRDVAMVFQEPTTFLNPVYTIGDQISEAIILHQTVNKRDAKDKAIEMLRRVRLPDPEDIVDRYPHQISGGQKQRAIIAMALSCHPSLLIADEPTTALDVTTEAQILALMNELQSDLGMSILCITHNLGVIAQTVEEVIVMYLGKVVEKTDVRTLFADAKHPYTQALLRSVPIIGRKSRQRLQAIKGVVPDPLNLPSGCRFHNRCSSYMRGICEVKEPPMLDLGNGHLVRCFLYDGSGVQSE
jgi:oligopeptide/dipeptide ABC transporter ATP-binding protein